MIGGQTTYKIKRTYQSPKTMAEALRKDDLTTIEAGHIVNYSQASMSRFKTGAKPMPLDAAIKLAEAVDTPFLAIDLANKTIHLSAPVINGDGVIKEPLAMAIRSIPEMKQAIEAVSDSFDELTTPVEKVLDTSDPMNTVDQLLDVMLYATNCAAFICDESAFQCSQN
ncbi:hypothetical protein [Lacticaseibacillus saniviri]|uniref:hypothetical protein n=1 Tax=Lacticaseibacillus saniviri TaxID=931533 RepID=UPI0006D21FF4|nr:hypothetical protein [Lacticaseibacillus saniviri]